MGLVNEINGENEGYYYYYYYYYYHQINSSHLTLLNIYSATLYLELSGRQAGSSIDFPLVNHMLISN